MADPNPSESQQLCAMAIADIMKKLPTQFPQYPEISAQFNTICEEEAFDDMDVLLDDVGEGFEESVLCENLADKINIKDEDKEPLCTALRTLLTNFQPALILNVAEMETKMDKEDVNAMKELVVKQVKYLEPTGKRDLDLLKVMIVGRKNNFPLLTYLLDAYARRRLLHYRLKYEELEQIESAKKREKFLRTRFEEYKERKFFEESDVMQKIESKDVLAWYEYSLKLVHRRGAKPLFITPMQTAECKINDSILTFAIYYIALLSATNNILQDTDTKLAQQIDFWVIPKSIKRADDDSDNDDDDEKDNDSDNDYNIKERLKFVDKLVTQTIENNTDIDVLSKTFFKIYKKIVAGTRSKRIVFLIDRRENEKNNGADKLYGFLPKNSQNIPSDANGDYLHEAMFNLSYTEILPNTNGGIKEDAINVQPTHDICVLSMHIHSINMVQAYWYFNGSYSRWFENDMVKIWPLYFVGESVDEKTGKITYQDVKPIVELIKKNGKNIPLKDDSFDEFFETTTKIKCAAYTT